MIHRIITAYFLCILLLSACSKEKQQSTTDSVTAVTGIYQGEVKKYGPASCTEIEGGQKVMISESAKGEISLSYIRLNAPAFVPFPESTAKLVAASGGNYYFYITPFENTTCKVWTSVPQQISGRNYNMVFHADGSVESHFDFYDFNRPQGDQLMDF